MRTESGGDTAYPSSNGYPQTAAVVNKRKSKTGLIVGIVAAVIILIVAIGIFIAGNSKKETLSFNLSVVNDTGVDIYALYASQPEVVIGKRIYLLMKCFVMEKRLM